MAGLVPVIPLRQAPCVPCRDAPDKRGHDGGGVRLAQIPSSRLPPPPPLTIVRRSSERSAARLAHQSGGLGVPSSNLGAPTTQPPEIISKSRVSRSLVSIGSRRIATGSPPSQLPLAMKG